MRILGIEIGTWSIKAVEMESKWRRLDILDFHEVRLPLQMPEPVVAHKQAVEQLLSALPSHPDKVVTSLPSSQTALRFLQVPVKARKKVEQLYRFELEDNIPFRIEDAIIEHHIEKMREGSLVFAALAPKRYIQTSLDWHRSIGIDPDWLTFDGMGFINLYLSTLQLANKEDRPEGLVVIANIGHTKTMIAVVDQGILKFFRSVPFGGLSITKDIALNQGCALEEAEEIKATQIDLAAEGKPRELNEIVAQGLSTLVADLQHTVGAFRNQYKSEPREMLLTGGTSQLQGLPEFLETAIELPTARFEPYRLLGTSESLQKKNEGAFVESWGRAMVFARKSPLLFNFRKGDMGKQTSLNEVSEFLKNPHVIKLLQFSALLSLILFVHVNVASFLADRQKGNAEEALRKVFQETFRAVPQKVRNTLTANPKDLAKFIDQKSKELEQKLKLSGRTHVPMGTLLKKVSTVFPATVKVDVNTLELDDKNLLMKGVLYEGDLAPVTEELKKLGLFADVNLVMDGQRFTYQAKVTGR